MASTSPNMQTNEPFSKRLAELERRAFPFAFALASVITGAIVTAVWWFGWNALIVGVIPTAVIWAVWRSAQRRS